MYTIASSSRSITYAHVYTRALAVGAPRLDGWVRRRFTRLHSHRARLLWGRHLLTLLRTQSVARSVSLSTLDFVFRVDRLAHLGAVWKLRCLQRRILRHLWRPGGRLMWRECQEAVFAIKPTQDAGASDAPAGAPAGAPAACGGGGSGGSAPVAAAAARRRAAAAPPAVAAG
jgi:hypothetical protein